MIERPDWDSYFLSIAKAVAARADCTRRRIGAVIVDSDHRIISTGYNGAPPSEVGCLSHGACPRGRHYEMTSNTCACGGQWPCSEFVDHGSSYDTGSGSCIAVHAEANALLFARSSVKGCTLYITDSPCDGCWRLVKAAGISLIRTPSTWWQI